MLCRLAILVGALLWGVSAQAQIFQSGVATPGHALRSIAPNLAGDGGGAAGGPAGANISELGIVKQTPTGAAPFGILDAPITSSSGYHWFNVNVDPVNGLVLDFEALGGATQLGASWKINGVSYPIPGAGTGNVVGPTSPYPTAGNVALWNGTTTLKDGGLAYGHVATNAALAAASTANYPQGLWRDAFTTAGDAPPQFFRVGTGACSAQSPVRANDGGSCVNSSDSNSWLANLGPVLDAREFGVNASDAAAVTNPKAQAVFDAAYTLSVPSVYFPTAINYTSLATYANLKLTCGGTANMWVRKSVGPGLYTTTAPGAGYPTSNVRNPVWENCAFNGEGRAGANFVIANAYPFSLNNILSFNTDTAAAQFQARISGSTVTALSSLKTASLTAAGTGYVVNERITLAGGTSDSAAVAVVNTVNGSGGVVTFSIQKSGAYTVTTTSFTQASTSGSGSGATFGSATWGLNQGAIVAGQMLLCQYCGYPNMSGNTYATIQPFGSGGTTGTGGAGTYQISASFATAVSTGAPMMTSTPWTFTGTGGNTTFPSANAWMLGALDGTWHNGALGAGTAGPGNTCPSFSGIGLALDSPQTDGGNKPNNLYFSGVEDWCNIIGISVFNGSDNTFVNGLHQNDIIGRIYGLGAANAFRITASQMYYEPQSTPPTGQAAIIYGSNATDNTDAGLGSLNYSQFTPVVLDYQCPNNAASCNSRNKVILNNDQTWVSSAPITTFYQGFNLGNPPAVPNQDSFVLDADDVHDAEFVAKAYQSGQVGIFSGYFQRGLHGAPAAVNSGDPGAYFGARFQYGTTQNQVCDYSSGSVNHVPCVWMAMLADGAHSPSSWPTRIEFGTTASSSTTPTTRFTLSGDGGLWAAGLASLGAGSVNATSIGLQNRTFLISPASAVAQLGAADAGTAVAQKLAVQSVVTGTSNQAGANFTIAGSIGTGSGAGGSLLFQVAPAGGSGTTQNALATALTIDSTKLATFAGAVTANGLTTDALGLAVTGAGAQIGSPTGGDKGAGTLNIQNTIWTNGTQGIASQTCTVNQAKTLIFTNGILTGGNCNS